MTKSVAIAVAGAGLMGKQHIKAIESCPGADLVALIDPDPAAADLALAHGAHHFLSLHALFAETRPDGLIIVTPNQLHHDHALEAIAAGVAVLVEKPIAHSVEAARAMVEAAAKTGVPLLTGHHRRHSPILQEAKAAIDGGALGQVVAAHAMCWFYKPADYFETKWRSEPGAGPVFLNLIHDVDNLRFLLGEVDSIQALQSHAQRGFAVEDSAAIILRFESGALATLNISDTIAAPWSWELTSGENPAYSQVESNCYVIGGTKGSLSIPRLQLWQHEDEPHWWKPIASHPLPHDQADPLTNQIANFRDVILGHAEPVCSGRDGLQTLRVITGIHQASSTGGLVQMGK